VLLFHKVHGYTEFESGALAITAYRDPPDEEDRELHYIFTIAPGTWATACFDADWKSPTVFHSGDCDPYPHPFVQIEVSYEALAPDEGPQGWDDDPTYVPGSPLKLRATIDLPRMYLEIFQWPPGGLTCDPGGGICE
jgi:hypothetical protein